jgi:hypothetical protein
MSVLFKIEVKVEIPKCRRHLEPKYTWHCNIKMNIREVKCGENNRIID